MSYITNLRKPYPNELYHHGILGQKWGVRRFQNADGSYTAAGKKRYNLSASKLFAPLTPVSSSRKLQKQCDIERSMAKKDPVSGLKIQSESKTLDENVKRVNPAYGEGRRSKNSDLAKAVTNNCVNCTIALEMRRRGYEVQALYDDVGKYGLPDGQACFKKAKPVHVIKDPDEPKTSKERDAYLKFYIDAENDRMHGNKKLIKKATDAMAKEPIGSRGMVVVDLSKYSSHAMGYEIMPGGKLRIIDAQSGKIYDGKNVNKVLKNVLTFGYERFDNLEANYENIKEAVM